MCFRPLFVFVLLFGCFPVFSQSFAQNTSGTSLPVGYTLIESNRPNTSYFPDSLKEATNNKKPIPISLWFPTEHAGQSKMTYLDYAQGISKTRTQEENVDLYLRMLTSFSQDSTTIQQSDFQGLLNTTTKAFNTESLSKSKYPLLLLLGGQPIYQMELAESIAANGYIVASIPRIGPVQGQRMPFDTHGTEEYKKDLGFVVDYLSRNEAVDVDSIHFVVWSFEGIPAFEYAQANKNVKGFISLDSSMGYDYGEDLITDQSNFYKKHCDFPLVHFTGLNMDYGKDLSILEALGTDCNTVIVDKNFNLSHKGFTSISSVTSESVRSREVNPIYRSLLDHIIFLLKNDYQQ